MWLKSVIVGSAISLICCDSAGPKASFNGSTEKNDELNTVFSSPSPSPVATNAPLQLSPSSIVLFAGEEASFKLVNSQSEPSAASWKSMNESFVSIKSPGSIKALAGGSTKIQAVIDDETAYADVKVVACKNDSSGQVIKSVRVRGENWPNNTVDPGGADFADYDVSLSGDLLLDGYAIYSRAAQTLSLSFELDDPGTTTQTVTLAIIDCQGRIKSQHVVSQKLGTHQFTIEKGDRFNILTTAVTGSLTRNYELLKDQSTAFRLDRIN